MSVKETPVTSAFEDDADQVECALEISVLIPPIARTCPNHLVPVDGDTGLCCLIWLTRNRLSPIPQTLRLSISESIAFHTQSLLSLGKL